MAHVGRTRASRSSLTPPTGGAAWIGIEQEQRIGSMGGSTRTTVRISPARRDAAAASEWGRRREGPRPSQRRQRRAVIGLRDAATADALDPREDAAARRVERILADLGRRPAGGPAGPASEEAASAAAGADGRRLISSIARTLGTRANTASWLTQLTLATTHAAARELLRKTWPAAWTPRPRARLAGRRRPTVRDASALLQWRLSRGRWPTVSEKCQ